MDLITKLESELLRYDSFSQEYRDILLRIERLKEYHRKVEDALKDIYNVVPEGISSQPVYCCITAGGHLTAFQFSDDSDKDYVLNVIA